MYIAVAEYLSGENIERAIAINGIAEQGDGYRVVQVYEYFLRQEWDGEKWDSPRVPVRGTCRQGIPLYGCPEFAGSEYMQP